jgi:hypothetical protein
MDNKILRTRAREELAGTMCYSEHPSKCRRKCLIEIESDMSMFLEYILWEHLSEMVTSTIFGYLGHEVVLQWYIEI